MGNILGGVADHSQSPVPNSPRLFSATLTASALPQARRMDAGKLRSTWKQLGAPALFVAVASGWMGWIKNHPVVSGMLGLKGGGGLTEGLHVASTDVLDLPGLDVRPSSYRCPESFFAHDGLWPARRLAFTERLLGLVLRAAAPRSDGAISHRALSSMETSDSDSSRRGGWDGEGDRGEGRRGLAGAWRRGGLSVAGVERFCAQSLAMSQATQA